MKYISLDQERTFNENDQKTQDAVERMYKLLNFPPYHKSKTENRFEALKCILANLFQATFFERPLRYSRSRDDYTKTATSKDWYSYRNIIPIVDRLREKGWIEQKNAFYDKRIRRLLLPTRIYLKKPLIDFFIEHNLTVPSSIAYVPAPNSEIRLKKLIDGKWKFTDFTETPETRQWRSDIREYNRHAYLKRILLECNGLPSGDLGSLKDLVNWGKALPLSYGGLTEGGIKPLYGTPASWDQYGKYKMWVEYQGSWRKNSRLTKSDCLLLTKENIYRLFNGDFRTNGRFYGPAHQQPSEKARENLFIDGEETGERDYAGMLLGLALNKMGVSYNGDPYYRITGGDELLKEVYKKVGYRVLCSVDKVGKSGRSTTARNRAIGSLNQERINKKLKMPKGLTSDKAIDEFIKAYPEIEPLLFRGKGLELNFIDSWIMSNVIKRLLSQNIFPLTVHDSVIAQKKYLGEVEKVMDEEYEKVMYEWTGQRFKPVIK